VKFGRWYEIRIKTPSPNSDLITITPPISAIIDVDRAARASVNNCKITLYNLKESTRNKIYRDVFDFDKYWQMIIVAGYGNSELYEIFRGNIQTAFSYHQGTEWITEIEGYDAAYSIQNGFINETVTAGTPKLDIMKRVVHSMPGLIDGFFGRPSQGESQRGQVLFGASKGVMDTLTDNRFYIDSETAYVMDDDEVIGGDAFIVGDPDDPNNGGLFTTPKRREEYMEVETLFSPEIRMYYVTEIHSMDKRYDGQYKTIGVKHSVTFSGATCGDARTSLSLSGGKVFNRLAQ
jgi:hypothetical protein